MNDFFELGCGCLIVVVLFVVLVKFLGWLGLPLWAAILIAIFLFR